MKILCRLTALVITAAVSLSAIGEEKTKVTFEPTEVGPGLFMLLGMHNYGAGNLGLSIGEDGVVLIDDSVPGQLELMTKAIESHTKKPVDFVINTHVHGDHMGNNVAMTDSGSRIVAHENLRTHLLTKGIRGKKAPDGSLPVITFSHSMSFHLNGLEAKLIHLPDAHTDGDAIVHYPGANVIHAGDIFFNYMFPFIDYNSGGSLDGYIKAQEVIIGLSDAETKIIPGHGPLANVDDLKASVAMLKESRKLIAQLHSAGKSEDEVVKLNPLDKFSKQWHWRFITTERMTRQVYQGLSDK